MANEVILPAIKARIGDWIYYSAVMKFKDITNLVKKTTEVHTSTALNDMIQRRLSNRAPEIKDYLVNHKQRFFNSIVIGVYGHPPRWNELSILPNEHLGEDKISQYVEGKLGFVRFSGEEKLFAIDGQHRVAGIKEAVKSHKELNDEEISVLFVAHQTDKNGIERTRRLFTTLNRYAKAVKKLDLVILDEDNVIAIITRRLFENYPLFIEKLSDSRAYSLSPSDQKNFTLITTLFDVLDIYLKDYRLWKDYKKVRPTDDEIDRYYNKSIIYFDALVKKFPALKELYESRPDSGVVSKYRYRNGGNILFRPLGIKLYTIAIKQLEEKLGWPLHKSVDRISKIPQDITKLPWKNLIWNDISNKMKTDKETQKVALQLIIYLVGGNLEEIIPKTNENKLVTALSGLLLMEEKDILKSDYFKKNY